MLLFTACSSPAPKEPDAATPGAEVVLGVGVTFTPQYTIVRTERFDVGGTPRLSMRVTVPRGLTRAELEANMRHALLQAYEAGPVRVGAVSVLAYSSAKTDGAFDAASADFAPNGRWSAASTDVPLSGWQVQVTLAESYFQKQSTAPRGKREGESGGGDRPTTAPAVQKALQRICTSLQPWLSGCIVTRFAAS